MRISLFNREAERIFGYSQEDVAGQPMDILLSERYREFTRGLIEALWHSEKVSVQFVDDQPIIGQRKDGREFAINGSISKLELNGKLIFTFMLRDVTQHMLIEADLERHRNELEGLVKARTEELFRTNEKLQNEISIRLEHARLLAAAIERNRLARDLHDCVTQVLYSANLVAEVLPEVWKRDPNEGQEALQELLHLTRAALAEMRTLLLELRPEGASEHPPGRINCPTD